MATAEEVSRHSNKDSLWVIHKGNVYDVTDFTERHPGGAEILIAHGGQDVTSVMTDEKTHCHSSAAYAILQKYHLGELHDGKKKRNGHVNQNGIGVQNGNGVLGHMQGWREDELVDWSKPIYHQVGNLGSNYLEWVHSPIDRHMRLFYSDLYEFFSQCPWYVVPLVWCPMVAFFLMIARHFFREGSETWIPWAFGGIQIHSSYQPGIFIFGFFLWSLFEYIIHRWIFHIKPPVHWPFLVRMHFIFHGQHHKTPMDKNRLVFPPVPAFAMAAVLALLFFTIFPPGMAMTVLAGVATGYMGYDLTHYYLHHGDPSLMYFKGLKKYHIKHHFVNQQKGFGISSKIWDYPFGTLIPDSHAKSA